MKIGRFLTKTEWGLLVLSGLFLVLMVTWIQRTDASGDAGSYTITTRETPYGPVRVKKAQGYGVRRSKPEYEDMARIAREHKITLKQIFHKES